MSEIINGYELCSPFQSQNAGFSRWTFAKRRGKEYFLMEFMDPVYPDEQSLSEKNRLQRIAVCQEFERRSVRLFQTLGTCTDGNLVRPAEFFRCDSRYYLAMPKVQGCGMSLPEIAAEPMETKALLCRTAAHSLMLMHLARLVHGDIKESNVMIQKTATGRLAAKIIDYDGSFFESDPPAPGEDLAGDQVYLAPEACLFICGEPAVLSCKLDVFALGLLFHQYLTGALPAFDTEEYYYAHEAVLDGQSLGISGELPEPLQDMLRHMLAAEPAERADLEEVFETLGAFIEQIAPLDPPEKPAPTPDPGPVRRSPPGSRGLSGGGFFQQAGDL